MEQQRITHRTVLFVQVISVLALMLAIVAFARTFRWDDTKIRSPLPDNPSGGQGNSILDTMNEQERITTNGTTSAVRIAEKPGSVTVFHPLMNQAVENPLTVEGEAKSGWFQEGSFPVFLRDQGGSVLARAQAEAQTEWKTEQLIPFKAILAFESSPNADVELVLATATTSPDSAFHEELIVPLIVSSNISDSERVSQVQAGATGQPTSTTTNAQLEEMLIFFGDPKRPSNSSECGSVVSVKRSFPKSQNAALIALNELLRGPTEEETRFGYSTAVNPGTVVQRMSISRGVANIDLNELVELNMGDSCKPKLLQNQISETLKQFPGISRVTITVNGNISHFF